jgi:hypothetical protein
LHEPGANAQHLQTYAVMGTLDDAIREHLDLKRRLGTPEDELEQKEAEAFGPSGAPRHTAEPAAPPDEAPEAGEPPPPPPPADPWEPPGGEDDLLERDEVLAQDSLEPNGSYAAPEPLPPEMPPEPATGQEEPHEDPFDEQDQPPPGPTEDVLEETPEFLEETPEHDRLWFEQKPPKDFDLD